MSERDPVFETWAEVEAWVKQRVRYPDPSPTAKLDALEDVRRVTLAHLHLKEQSDE